jgi:hypothetical protein
VAPLRRWLPFAAAALATALLASGVGVAANRLSAPAARPAPQLKTVAPAVLDRVGISLAAASQPPYCGVADAAVNQRWLRPGSAGCAISQDAAEAMARRGGSARVLESVLALVTSTRIQGIGRDHLAWLVVVQQSIRTCQQSGGWAMCSGPARGFAWSQIALVDAYGGGVISTLRLSPTGGRPPIQQTLPSAALLGN